MLTLLVLLSVFEFSLQQCCFPSQWEGIESGTIATVSPGAKAPVYTSFNYLLSVDYSKHLLSLSGSVITGPSTTQMRVIRDYTAKLQYSIDTATNVCTKSVLAEKEIPCLGSNGDNSTVMAQTHLGASGQQLAITVYNGVLNGMPSTLSVSEGCIPVGVAYHGMSADGSRVVGSIGFHGITGGISDASVFTVPANCISSPLVNSVVG